MNLSKMRKPELIACVQSMMVDKKWGCYTKDALITFWDDLSQNAVGIAYCDIDDMHSLNSRYGHTGTDNRIAFTIEQVRSDDVVACRWCNGDELIFILKSGNSYEFCKRMQREFKELNIRATFACSDTVTECFDTIEPLDNKVQRSKNMNRKGVILR